MFILNISHAQRRRGHENNTKSYFWPHLNNINLNYLIERKVRVNLPKSVQQAEQKEKQIVRLIWANCLMWDILL
jgi:hypothetical protein